MTVQWQSDTGLANVGYGIHLRTRLIGRFPIYREATDQPHQEMKLYYRDWVPSNDSLLEWHPSGWSDTGVVQMTWHWRIGSPLAYLDIHWDEIWFKWIFSDTVTLQWHSGSALGGFKFG